MPAATCPSVADLERLFLGGLAEKTADEMEQHVQGCNACLEQLKTLLRNRETLSGVLSDDTANDALAGSPVVTDLMKKLETLRQAPPSPSGIEDMRTVVPPQDKSQTAATTPKPGKLDVAANENGPGPDSQTALTEFLSPAQNHDELGRLGKYRILKILGYGGMGVVYKAEDSKLKRSVAIKAMLPGLAASASAGKRFLREAEAMAAVEHDHIVRIYLVDEDRGVPFMAMEFLKGEPLDERLKREDKIPVAEVVRIGREIAEGLGAAHTTGLIHRDIKPGNIWLEAPKNRVKILDFGLARAASQDAGLTQQGAIIGTPAYMAPEQGRGEPTDARCDLFSLGVVLYRMCTGQLPFKGADTVSTLMAVAVDQPPAPIKLNAALPKGLSDLVMKLLEKDPAKRIGSAAEVVERLQALEQQPARKKAPEDKTLAVPTAAPQKSVAPRRRRSLVIAAAVLLAVLVGGVAALVYLKVPGKDNKKPPGAFVIDTNDEDFVFNVNKEGGVTLKDKKTHREYKLTVMRQDKDTGEYELEVTDVGGDLTFKTKRFTIKRGDTVVASLWFERKPDELPDKVTDAWVTIVAALAADKQVQLVTAMLKKLNPDLKDEVTPKIEGKVVTGLTIQTDNLTDLTPIRALTELRSLTCAGLPAGKHQLSDLSPLEGLKLTSLSIGKSKVSNLAPLKGMPLTVLHCGYTPVKDLSPLKDMKLLTDLDCHNTEVSDLLPLKGIPLTTLNCYATKVADLSPLKNMPLKELTCDFKPERDATILASIKTLEKINDKPAAAFWKEVDVLLPAFDKEDVKSTPPPAGAIVLFDGKSLDGWTKIDGTTPVGWKLVEGGAVEAQGSNIVTKQKFGDSFQLHVEFRVPLMPDAKGQKRGNSGVYLQGRYEVQILDSYRLPITKVDCGAIFQLAAPLKNVCKAPLVWQSYDIEFTSPKCDGGKVVEPARATVYHNGVKIHDDVRIAKSTVEALGGDPCTPGPIMLQYNAGPVQFRDIWLVQKKAAVGARP